MSQVFGAGAKTHFQKSKSPPGGGAASPRALAIYDNLTARFPDDTLALKSSTVPLIALGELYGPDGATYLRKALAILKQLDEAGRLEPRRKSSIAQIEAELARLQEEHPPEADLRPARWPNRGGRLSELRPLQDNLAHEGAPSLMA